MGEGLAYPVTIQLGQRQVGQRQSLDYRRDVYRLPGSRAEYLLRTGILFEEKADSLIELYRTCQGLPGSSNPAAWSASLIIWTGPSGPKVALSTSRSG